MWNKNQVTIGPTSNFLCEYTNGPTLVCKGKLVRDVFALVKVWTTSFTCFLVNSILEFVIKCEQ